MRKRFWLIGALWVLLACGLWGPTATEVPSEDVVATWVAATLQAHATASPAATPTPTPAPTVQPRPQAAYLVDGNVWLWQPGSAARQLTTTGDVVALRLAPDGQTVALVRALDALTEEIWAVDADGTHLRRLVGAEDLARLPHPEEAEGLGIYAMDWVPGTHTLAFTTRLLLIGPGLVLNGDLYLVDADTLEQRPFLAAGEGGAFVFAPDGQRLVVITPTQVDLLWLDGRAPRQRLLTYEPVLTYSEYAYLVAPQWASDGSYLLTVVPPADPMQQPTPPSTVWRLPTDGSAAVPLAQIATGPFWFPQADTPIFDPSLTYMVYLSQSGDLWSLHWATPDGGRDTVVATAPQVTFFGWAPTGGRFVYALEQNPPLLGQIEGPPVPLTDEGMDRVQEVAWVTDDTFLFVRRLADQWGLYAATLGGENRLIATATDLPQVDVVP